VLHRCALVAVAPFGTESIVDRYERQRQRENSFASFSYLQAPKAKAALIFTIVRSFYLSHTAATLLSVER
jgi:hypothetical protein